MPQIHLNYISEPALEETLWRYLSFPKYVSMLSKNSLFFARLDKMDDPWEGFFSLRARNAWIKKYVPLSKRKEIEKILDCARGTIMVNCWHASEYESMAMWSVYGNIGDSLAIQSSVSNLQKAIKGTTEDLLIGEVRYVDDVNEAISPWPLETAFLKRRAYEYEREVRIVNSYIPSNDQGAFEPSRLPGEGKSIVVDVNELIISVRVHPKAPDWILSAAEDVSKAFGMEASVDQSSLADVPPQVLSNASRQ